MKNYNLDQSNNKKLEKRYGMGISNEEKNVLTVEQLKKLKETGILEGEFLYKDGKPVKFVSIDDVDFSLENNIDVYNFYIEIPKTKEEFKKRFRDIFNL